VAAKKPSIKVPPIPKPLRDIIKKAMKGKGSKALKDRLDNASKNAIRPRSSGRFSGMTAAQRADDRAKRMGPSLTQAERAAGKKYGFNQYDKYGSQLEVNSKIARRDSWLTGDRLKKGKPLTENQIRQAKILDAANKERAPKFMKKQSRMSENEMLAKNAKKQGRKDADKAAGGVNSPANRAKRAEKAQKARDEARANIKKPRKPKQK
jgi:hypothetical protein